MRKTIIAITVAGLVAGLAVMPAQARGKAKKVHESMTAQLLPFPKDTRWEVAGPMPPGCTAGQEDVNWVAVPFTAPGKGNLRFYMEGFDGDHDIYIFNAEGFPIGRGDQAQVGDPTAPAPPEEEIILPMTKGLEVTLAMCNWAGAPDVVAHYEGTFR
jgi:hypothetical protein